VAKIKVLRLFLVLTFSAFFAASGCSPASDSEGATNSSSSNASVASSASTAVETTAAVAAADAESSNVDAAVMALGKTVYNRNCVACHQPNGQGIPPAFPAIAGSAIVLGDVDGQILQVLNGVTGTAMVAFGPQLSDEDIAAVVTYQRNSFGNQTGDVVGPEQVTALR